MQSAPASVFTQRELRKSSRNFAQTVLKNVKPATSSLTSPFERFLATRPMYEEAIRQGFMRKLIPAQLGGEGGKMTDMGIMAEEFYAVDASMALTVFANALGLIPILGAGSEAQREKCLAPFLRTSGAPLAALADSEPGGSANFDAPPPAVGTRTLAYRDSYGWVINGTKQWVSNAGGWDEKGADFICVTCRTSEGKSADESLTLFLVEKGTPDLVFDHYIDSVGHRAHSVPCFSFNNVRVPDENVIGTVGGALGIVNSSFKGNAALFGVFALG